MSDQQPAPRPDSYPTHSDAVAQLIDRLGGAAALGGPAGTALRSLSWTVAEPGVRHGTRTFDAYRGRVMVVLSGIVFQHAIVRSGARQVVGLRLPGDLVGVESLHGIGSVALGAHGPVQVAVFDAAEWRAVLAVHEPIRQAVEAELALSLSIARAWLTNNCRREAAPRVAHLLCELAHRTGSAGLPRLTQEFLSDCVGLTSVHTNRVLRRLEAMGCLRRDGDRYQLSDVARLRDFAEFDPGYLASPVAVYAVVR